MEIILQVEILCCKYVGVFNWNAFGVLVINEKKKIPLHSYYMEHN